ncbi:MAG: aminotransferase class IV [Verrucomicrobia bacterium]|nr:aminotransferase class IV [Verrucomicrobiota bacterium]
MLAIDGRVAFGEAHWRRLGAGCARLGWICPAAWEGEMAETAGELLERNGLARGKARVRAAISGGSGSLADLAAGTDRRFWMTASALGEAPGGLVVGLSRWRRNEMGPLSGLKCASYAENLVALDEARRSGFGETLFFNTSGHLCEAATANVFLVRDGILRTPSLDSGCLPGVARCVVLELAKRAGIPCAEGRIPGSNLESAEEIFLTSATRGPVSVARCDTRDLPSTAVADRLRELWWQAAVASAGGKIPKI